MADGNDSGSGGSGAGEEQRPLTTFLWAVKIDDLAIDSQASPGAPVAIFTSCTGLKFERPVTPYHEGGQRDYVHWVAGALKWTNIVLKRGMSGDKKFFEWKTNPCRHDLSIMHLGDGLQPVITYLVKNAWPVKWQGPSFDASKNETGIETIEIAHEGLEVS